MLEFRLVGPNPGFHDIICHGETLREAMDLAKADIVRQTIGFHDPLISVSLFEAAVEITRIELPGVDDPADTSTAFFSVDVSVYLNGQAAEPAAAVDAQAEASGEIAWFHKRSKELPGGNGITKTFMVYGDDPSF
jgi:hypothetical protein